MKIIKENKEAVYFKEKSKFIAKIYKVFSKEEIDTILNSLIKEYPDATHICYGYLLPNMKKYSDDKEPTNTAGLPITIVLEKNNLCYVLGVVIRYFGGIKLGTNGLIRAYSTSISNTLTNNIKDIEYGYLIEICEDYSKNDLLNYLLKDAIIINKNYQEKITIQAIIKKEMLAYFSNIHYIILEDKIL